MGGHQILMMEEKGGHQILMMEILMMEEKGGHQILMMEVMGGHQIVMMEATGGHQILMMEEKGGHQILMMEQKAETKPMATIRVCVNLVEETYCQAPGTIFLPAPNRLLNVHQLPAADMTYKLHTKNIKKIRGSSYLSDFLIENRCWGGMCGSCERLWPPGSVPLSDLESRRCEILDGSGAFREKLENDDRFRAMAGGALEGSRSSGQVVEEVVEEDDEEEECEEEVVPYPPPGGLVRDLQASHSGIAPEQVALPSDSGPSGDSGSEGEDEDGGSSSSEGGCLVMQQIRQIESPVRFNQLRFGDEICEDEATRRGMKRKAKKRNKQKTSTVQKFVDSVLRRRFLEALKKGERTIEVEGRVVDLAFWLDRHGLAAFQDKREGETVWSLPTAGQGVARRNVVRLRWRGSEACPPRARVVELLLKMDFRATDIFALIHLFGTSFFDVSFVRPEGLELFWSNFELAKGEPGWRDFAVQAVSRQNSVKRVTVLT
ncbi:unnamed protein product, partial [Ranitomeya imitator]